VRVHTLDGEVLAWLYVLDDYVAELRSRPCRSVGPGPVVD
jgi:hypothetical protein